MNDASRLHRPESARVVALSLFYWTPHNIVFLACLPKWHGKHAFANSIHESTSRTFHLGIYVHSGGLSWSKWFLEVAKSSYRRGEDFGVQDLAACQQHARTHQVGTLKPPLVLFLLTPQIHAQTCSMFFLFILRTIRQHRRPVKGVESAKARRLYNCASAGHRTTSKTSRTFARTRKPNVTWPGSEHQPWQRPGISIMVVIEIGIVSAGTYRISLNSCCWFV